MGALAPELQQVIRYKTIPSLALLKVRSAEGLDYLDNFVPLACECIRQAKNAEVSLPEVKEAVKERFGLSVPLGALRLIMERAVGQGYLEETRGIFRRVGAAFSGAEFSDSRHESLRQYEALLDKLRAFCRDRHGVHWTVEEADNAFVTHLRERAAPILALCIGGRDQTPSLDPLPPASGAVEHADFLVSSFITELDQRDPAGFEYLKRVAQGTMLAYGLVFPNVAPVDRSFVGMQCYFDTEFLLRACGLAGETMACGANELLDLLRREGSALLCFEHTFAEMKGVLRSCGDFLRNHASIPTGYSPTLKHFISRGSSAGDVELEIARLGQSLSSLGIDVREPPRHALKLGLQEEQLASVLQERVGYLREATRTRDVDSISSIYRLRHGKFPASLQACNAIFVTTNRRLTLAASDFFRSAYPEARDALAVSVVDSALAALVWLKKPVEAPDLPPKYLIADCYAALEPSDYLWKQYQEEARRLEESGRVSAEDYDLLRYWHLAPLALMNSTLGDSESFTEGTVMEVLEAAQAHARVGVEAELASSQEENRRLREQIDLSDAEQAKRQRDREVRRRVLALKAAKCIVYPAGALLFSCVVCLALLGLPDPFPRPLEGLARLVPTWISLIAALVTAALAVAEKTWGGHLTSVLKDLEKRTARTIERFLRYLAELI